VAKPLSVKRPRAFSARSVRVSQRKALSNELTENGLSFSVIAANKNTLPSLFANAS
jgi:hypothetical protein